MPGVFSKSNRPRRPGAYFNFEAQVAQQVPVATGSIVAVPYTHIWGPFKQATLVTNWSEWVSIFGEGDPDDPSPGVIAVKQAFKGEGVSGRGGAGAVLAYRTGTSRSKTRPKPRTPSNCSLATRAPAATTCG
jgi:hypothetical protein